MSVKIIVDSTADLPQQLAENAGISIVPCYVRFGDISLRDRIDISEDAFFERLQNGSIFPTTSQPSPQDFIDVYQENSDNSDGIFSICVSRKLSGTYDSAFQARQSLNLNIPIEIVDSQSTTIGLGVLAMLAARLAQEGKTLSQITTAVNEAIPTIHLLGFFDTLKYLMAGGRIGKAKGLIGSVLNVKPVLTLKDGELHPSGQVRSRIKGADRLVEYAGCFSKIEDLWIVHANTENDAQDLAARLGEFFPREKIVISRLGAAIGSHAGPGTLFVCVRGR
ncbi:MAG: DegV family protein [Dehalogenimonas sp.]